MALIVESGLVGTFLVASSSSATSSCGCTRRGGSAGTARRLGDADGARAAACVGVTAALVGTIAANFFYLTMQFYYFYAFLAFCSRCPSCSVGARATRIELDRQKDPIRLGPRLAQQAEIGAVEAAPPGVAQGTGVSLPELPEPSGRPLDVAVEVKSRARRQLRHELSARLEVGQAEP